jgi:uncharacterized membrane protein
MMPMMSWFGSFSMLFTSVTLIILVAAACVLVLTAGQRRDRRDDAGEDLLRRRYAAGEIDTEEYQKRLTTLRAADGAQR